MNWLQALAIMVQMADATNTCHMLKDHRFKETGFLLGDRPSCTRLYVSKAVVLAPMFVTKGKTRNFIIGLNISTGSVGLAISLRTRSQVK